jgi:hypothetical protein
MWSLRSTSKALGAILLGSLLTSTAFATQVPAATQRCQNLTTGSFTPIARCISGNYFCVGSTPTPLVGVSADAACHIPLSDNTVCNVSNAKEVIDSIITGNNLNKMRLWVSLAGDSPVTDPAAAHPFTKTGAGYWRLDRINGTYFNNLQNVVDYARLNNIKVEITFFAPWEGNFATGPWNNANGKVCVNGAGQWQPSDANCTTPGNVLQNAGFSNQAYFVQTALDPVNGDHPRRAQRNLINWIIARLWCYDNVYWEIANEPESDSSVTPAQVQQWHTSMINHTITMENAYVGATPGETRRHRIAVNPTKNVINYVGAANVDVVNGHYTEIFEGTPDVGLGAIELMRASGNSAAAASRLLGFNETKISTIGGNAGTLPGGAPDSARAEGWEFMLNQGAIYDHWGYNYSSANGIAVRTQMRHLKNFVNGLPLRDVQRSGVDGSAAPPSWLPSLPNWATYRAPLNARLFWGALQPTSGAPTRVYALYLHNSLRRCDSGGTDTSTGCMNGMTSVSALHFNGYSPVIGTNKYRETLTLNLVPGTYRVEWIRPANGTSAQAPFNITYNADNSCTGGFSVLPCQIQSPFYDYDIALKLTQQ